MELPTARWRACVSYGPIGKTAQDGSKDFNTRRQAKDYIRAKLREKLSKRYEITQVTGGVAEANEYGLMVESAGALLNAQALQAAFAQAAVSVEQSLGGDIDFNPFSGGWSKVTIEAHSLPPDLGTVNPEPQPEPKRRMILRKR